MQIFLSLADSFSHNLLFWLSTMHWVRIGHPLTIPQLDSVSGRQIANWLKRIVVHLHNPVYESNAAMWNWGVYQGCQLPFFVGLIKTSSWNEMYTVLDFRQFVSS